MPRPRPRSFTNDPTIAGRVAMAWQRRLLRRSGTCCGDCLEKVAQHYPYKKCINDGLADGLTKSEAAYRCRWIACCRSKRENKFKQTGYCKDFDCSDKPKWSGKKAAAGKYDHIDFNPPASVARAAERGLEYRRKQKGDKAGLSTGEAAAQGIGSGVQRAVNLKNRDTLSPATVRRMHNFFNRHQKNKAIDPKHRGEPWKDKGYVAWLLWGGDPGRSWAAKVVRQMDAADERKKKASHGRSRCMESGCKKPPEMECIWADGRGRAWFCKKHWDAWSKDDTDEGMPKDIVKQRKVPNGVVGEKYGDYPGTGKKAKYAGTKTGDGESVGLFIPLPKHLAEKFPSLGEEDGSPSHVTFLYIGDFRGDEAGQERLVGLLRDCCSRWWPKCKAFLGKLSYFDHPDKNRRVPHVRVEFDKDMSGFKHRIRQELTDAGFEVQDRFPEYKPHVTLAYLPGMDAEGEGPVPQGSWDFEEMEIWGLPQLHRLQIGPSAEKVASHWLRAASARTVAERHGEARR